MVSPNKGTQIREIFPYFHQNFTDKGKSKCPLFDQKSFENKLIFQQIKWACSLFWTKLETSGQKFRTSPLKLQKIVHFRRKNKEKVSLFDQTSKNKLGKSSLI